MAADLRGNEKRRRKASKTSDKKELAIWHNIQDMILDADAKLVSRAKI